jgi:hypothetical protein
MKVITYSSAESLPRTAAITGLAIGGFTHVLHKGNVYDNIYKIVGGKREGEYELEEIKLEAPAANPLDKPVHPFYLVVTEGFGFHKSNTLDGALTTAEGQSKYKGLESIICAPFLKVQISPPEYTHTAL